MYAKTIKMQHAILDIRQIGTTNGYLGTRIGKLWEPQGDIFHHIVIRPFFFLRRGHYSPLHILGFPNTVKVMLLLGAIYGNANRQVVAVLLYKLLHLIRTIIDTISREWKSIGIEPMVVPGKHLLLQIITNMVYQVNLQERLATYKIPYHTLLGHVGLVVQYVINSSLCYLPWHSLLRVLANKVAVLTS